MNCVSIKVEGDPTGPITLDEAKAAHRGNISPAPPETEGVGVVVMAPEGKLILSVQHFPAGVGDDAWINGETRNHCKVVAVSDVQDHGEIPMDLALFSVPSSIANDLKPIPVARELPGIELMDQLYLLRPDGEAIPVKLVEYAGYLPSFRFHAPPGFGKGWSGSPIVRFRHGAMALVGIVQKYYPDKPIGVAAGIMQICPFLYGRTASDPDGPELLTPEAEATTKLTPFHERPGGEG